MSLLACALLASVRFQHLFNTILSLVGYMGHNYTRIGGKITPNFLQCDISGTVMWIHGYNSLVLTNIYHVWL